MIDRELLIAFSVWLYGRGCGEVSHAIRNPDEVFQGPSVAPFDRDRERLGINGSPAGRDE